MAFQAVTLIPQIKTVLTGLTLDQPAQSVSITFPNVSRLEDLNVHGRLRAAEVQILSTAPSSFWRSGLARYNVQVQIRVMYPIRSDQIQAQSLLASDQARIHKALMTAFNGPSATIDCLAGIFQNSSVAYTKNIGKGKNQASVQNDCYIAQQLWSVHIKNPAEA